ncbi:LysR family transcriptional regulator [Lysinibacillus sphaericus]|uniref:LysR family transcriptional regulator n=1 Tax=Lysinibacillus sphaericus TaxID=1421 RepID=UPI003D75B9A3
MNLHALRIFKTVAEFENVTKAAEYLCLSQPAVTIQIRHLEKELDVTLIQSKGRGIQLTKVGRILAKEAENLFSLETSIETKIANIKKQAAETIVIASTYLPATAILPPFISKYKDENEHIQFVLQSGNTKDMIHNLLNYKADIGIIVTENIDESNIVSKHWKDIEFYFVTHPKHKLANKEVTLDELVQYSFVMREEGSSTRKLFQSICHTQGVPFPKIGLVFNGLTESVQAVLSGYGITLSPSIAVERYLDTNQLQRIYVKNIEIIRPVHVCTRLNMQPNTSSELFLDFLLNNK